MFSGQVDDAARRQAASSGATGFIGKGFDLDELVDQAKAIVPV
jgi:DNA-binding NarL/FixJ family response regulator